MSAGPANEDGLAGLRALCRELGFEIVPIGTTELLAQAIRPVLREEINRALAELRRATSVAVSVASEPDECERPGPRRTRAVVRTTPAVTDIASAKARRAARKLGYE